MHDAVRGLVATLADSAPGAAAVRLAERSVPWPGGTVVILTYHRVAEPTARPDLAPGLISATPARFAEQMAVLADRYRPVSLAHIVDALARRSRLPPRAVHVTFDDAYADVGDAWATLRRLGIPATLFVPTGCIDRPGHGFWWDRLWAAWDASGRRHPIATPVGPLTPAIDDAGRSLRALRSWLKGLDHDVAMAEVDRLVGELGAPPPGPPAVLDWAALRRLAADGLVLAPHTRTHPLLDRVPFERAVGEIAGAYEDLTREIGPTPLVLAYPSGAHGGRAVEAARAAGMIAAVTTTRGGVDVRRADPLKLRRINVGARASTPLVRGQLVWASALARRQAAADRRRG